jgi:hypothetical protein
VTYAYNPSYSGDRDQEDCSVKPVRPYLEKPYCKKIGLMEWFKVKALKKNKQKKRKENPKTVRAIYKH